MAQFLFALSLRPSQVRYAEAQFSRRSGGIRLGDGTLKALGVECECECLCGMKRAGA